MNWNLGLRHISAVVWGIIGAVYGGAFLLIGFNDAHAGRTILLAALVLGALFLAHKLTCWVINGFFAKK